MRNGVPSRNGGEERDRSGQAVSPPLRDISVRRPGLDRVTIALLCLGVALEFLSLYAGRLFPEWRPMGDVLSFLAVFVLAGCLARLFHQFGEVGLAGLLVHLAAASIILSKFLDMTEDFDVFAGIAVIGRGTVSNQMLLQPLFTAGALLLLVGFVVAAIEAHRARFDLGERHKSLQVAYGERGRIEAALRENESRFRRVFDNILDVYCEVDVDGVVIEVTPSVKNLLGYTPAELRGKPVFDFHTRPELFHELRAAILENGRADDVEIPMRHKAGHDVWCAITAMLTGEDVDPPRIVGSVRDISARKRIEERLELAVRGADLGLWDWNLLTNQLNVNARLAEMFGQAPDARELTADFMLDRVHPEDRPGLEEVLDTHFSGATPLFEAEFRIAPTPGQWTWVLTIGKVIEWDDDGRPLRAAGTEMDITERKRVEAELIASEERYRSLVENCPEPIVRIDSDLHYVFANRAFFLATGLREDEVVGRHVSISRPLLPAGQYEEMLEDAAAVLAGEASLCSREIRYLDGEGVERWMSHMCYPWRLPDGGIGGVEAIGRDITDRKRAEEALSASEEKYRTFVENCPDAIVRFDRNMRFVFVNRAFLLSVGREEEDVLGQDADVFRPIFLGDGHERITRDTLAVLNGASHCLITEVAYRDTQGVEHWVSHMCYPWRLPDGGIGGVEVIGRDITEHRRAEQALRASDERYHSFVDNTPDPILRTDREGRCIFANRAAYEVFGVAEEQIVGRGPEAVAHLFGVGDIERVAADNRQILEGSATARTCEIRLLDRQGDWRWVEHLAHPWYSADGTVGGVEIILNDVTERKQSELERARLFTAIEQAAESVVICDKNGVIQYVNPAFERLTGYRREDALGHTPRFVRNNQYDDAFFNRVWEALNRGEVWQGRIMNRRKDGGLYEVHSTISPVMDERGDIVNFVALEHDISKETGLERQLRQAQKMEALGTLAGGIAHDFNNVLSLILGSAEMLLRSLPEDNALRGDAHRIQRAGNRAADLVRQILTFTRQVELKRRPLRPHLVIREAVGFLRASLPATIDIHSHIGVSCGMILGDPTQLHQVAINLCTNAYQAIGSDGGRLTVVLEDVEVDCEQDADAGRLRPGPYVRLTVADTGHGMDPNVIQRIFDPFFTTKSTSEGTGLGLSTVHGIVTGWEGAVTVESQPGKGATFRAYFPRIEHAEETQPPPDASLPRGAERILFVDDETELCEMGERTLDELGYVVDACSSGIEALELFRRSPDDYDLVVTDHTMPAITGFDMAREILRIRPEVPVILVTGFGHGITAEQAKRAGIAEFLQKPLAPLALATSIRKVLDSHIPGA